MKKIISLLLALAMVLSLAACGSSASEPPKGDIKPLEDTKQENNTPELALNESLCAVGCEDACIRVAHPDRITELVLEENEL